MIKAAVVGVGYWGPNLARNLWEHPEVELKYVCDKKTSRLEAMQRRYPGLKGVQDYQEILNDASVDLIVISTPVKSHFKLAAEALKSRRHVLITKPMAVSEVQCRQLIELANKYKRILMVDHTFVYHPAVQYIKQFVQDKKLGDLLYYHSNRMNLGLYQPDVSVIYDLMPHDLSILNELIQEDPVEISVTAKNAARLPQPDIAFLQLNYSSNFIASIHASWLSPSKIRETILTGSKKMVVYDDIDVVQRVKVFDKGVDSLAEQDRESSYVDLIQYRQGDVFSPAISDKEALRNEIEHLVDCINHDLQPKTDGFQGMRVVRLLECADKIARSNRCWSNFPVTNNDYSEVVTPTVPKKREIFV